MKTSTSPFSRIMYWLWAGFAGLLVTAAVLLSVVRMMLPLVEDYRQELVQFLSQELDREVRISAISMQWRGLYPELSLSGVDLLHDTDADAGQVWLHMDMLRVGINPFSWPFPGEYNLRSIQVVGTHLQVQAQADGAYLLNGVSVISAAGKTTARGELLGWLLSRSRLGLAQSTVSYMDAERGRSIHLEDATFEVTGRDGAYQFGGHFSAGQGETQRLALVMKLTGDLEHADGLAMEFYLEGNSSLRPWQDLGAARLRDMQGEVSLQVWGSADRNGLQRLQGDVRLQDLFWPGVGSEQNQVQPLPLSLKSMAGNFFWRRQTADGWALDVEQYRVEHPGNGLSEPARFSVVKSMDVQSAEPIWYGSFDALQLHDANKLLQSLLPLPQQTLFAMTTLQPRGVLHDGRFRYYGHGWKLEHLYLQAAVSQLQVSSWHSFPAVYGVDAELEMNGAQGRVMLSNSGPVLANFHGVFIRPLKIEHLGARVDWQVQETGWRLVAEEMQAANDDLKAHGRMELRHEPGMATPFLDMQVSFSDGDVANAYRYLPHNKLGPGLLAWLEHALAGGRIGSGAMLFSGEAGDFPFDHNEGVFEVRFNVEDMLFPYMEGWPQAHSLQADVLFSGRSLALEIVEAGIFGLELLPTRIEIKDLSEQALLELAVKTRGPLSDLLRFLRESPAGAAYAPFLAGVQSDGEADFALQLKLPINDSEARVLSGELLFRDNDVRFSHWATGLERIAGTLRFDFDAVRHQFKADDIRALYRGNDANINVFSLAGAKQGMAAGQQQTRIDIHTLLDASALLDQYAPVLKDVLQGASPGLASLRISTSGAQQDNDVVLYLESMLEGIELNLPGQFAHTKGQRHKLAVELGLTNTQALPVSVDYDGRLKAALLLDRNEADKTLTLLKGAIALGGMQPLLPTGAQIDLTGELDRLDLNQWLAWYESVVVHQRAGANSDPGEDAGGLLQQVKSAELSLGELKLGGYAFHNARLEALRHEHYWELQARSDELQGTLRIPQRLYADEPLVMDLERVNLQDMQQLQGAGAAPKSNPEHWPLLKVFSRQVVYNGVDYGELAMTTRRLDRGVRFEQLNVSSSMLTAAATGSWVNTDTGPVSDFSVQLSTPDLGRLLRQWNYHDAIEKGMADARMEVTWSGSPTDFAMEHVEGDIALTIQKGRLLDVESSGGRVFGLLSIQALPRRLALDFSDVYKKGLSFDRIEGKFSLVDGNAYTNDLFLQGPAAHIDISGRIGLVNRDYDQDVYVTPRISSTIPVVGGLAGGPGVGLGLLLAEHLLKGRLDKLSRIHYEVKGSWEQPQVVRIEE